MLRLRVRHSPIQPRHLGGDVLSNLAFEPHGFDAGPLVVLQGRDGASRQSPRLYVPTRNRCLLSSAILPAKKNHRSDRVQTIQSLRTASYASEMLIVISEVEPIWRIA